LVPIATGLDSQFSLCSYRRINSSKLVLGGVSWNAPSTGGLSEMIRRPLRPTFPYDLREPFLSALERARDLAIQFRSAQKFGSDAMARADALTEAVDGMAEELTGDRTHFHLKGHGR
jgi:hypothetical protein